MEILKEVSGLKTLPAVAVGGRPSIPVTTRVGLQILYEKMSFKKEINRKPVQIAGKFIIRDGLSGRNPREFADQILSYDSDDFSSFFLSVLGDFDVEVLGNFTSFGVFKSSKELKMGEFR